MTRSVRFETWDVFTRERFAGNPLAVVKDADALREDELAAISREFNLSETVFLYPPTDTDNIARIRIFTPGRELAFAGHPTIGAAHAIAAQRASRAAFNLELKAGVFAISFDDAGATFVNPNPPTATPSHVTRAMLADALGLESADILAAPMVAGAPTPFLTVEAPYDALGRMAPDMSAIARLGDEIYVVARAPGEPEMFRTRMFAPSIGVPEDPATGSAACALPAYVAATSGLADGHCAWTVEQGVEMGRPSLIRLAFDVSAGSVGVVAVSGAAIRMQAGELHLDD
ncbi:MAG: PhzF family phenazine biosynthesis isomerase [Alphaproteobacteria bacterium]|nr:PhzF family phenazine biosynthesis isomerase [Alphaproteobacteria bacterium]